MRTNRTSFDAQIERKLSVDAPVRGDARPGDDTEDAREVEVDELAEAIRAKGVGAREALVAALACMEFFTKKDRAVCEGEAGAGQSESMADSQVLRAMLFRLLEAPRPKFSIGCLILAAGFNHEGVRSAREWAAARKLSPEHAANEAEIWRQELGLPKTLTQKSEQGRSVYRRTNGARRQIRER